MSAVDSAQKDFYNLSTSKSSIIGSPLIRLLLKFYSRKCSVARDRIFSLVSLCSEKDRIKVDYECSVFQLAHQLVSACRSTICICTTLLILDMLGSEIYQLSSDELTALLADGPYLEFELEPTEGQIYPNDNAHLAPCALLKELVKDSGRCATKCDREHKHKKTPNGVSWCNHTNRHGVWKFRVSFLYAWIWYKKQERSQQMNIRQRLSIQSRLVGKVAVPIDGLPRLGWGNWNIHAD